MTLSDTFIKNLFFMYKNIHILRKLVFLLPQSKSKLAMWGKSVILLFNKKAWMLVSSVLLGSL